jgi:hypothetical protein
MAPDGYITVPAEITPEMRQLWQDTFFAQCGAKKRGRSKEDPVDVAWRVVTELFQKREYA